MLLTIDVGNTQTVIGLLDGEAVVGHWRLTTNPEQTEDELRISLHALLELDGFAWKSITGVAVSSVVPALTHLFREVGTDITGGDVVVVGRNQHGQRRARRADGRWLADDVRLRRR